MLELSVAAFTFDLKPSVLHQQFYNLSGFHGNKFIISQVMVKEDYNLKNVY